MKNIANALLLLSLPFLLFFVAPPDDEIRQGAMLCRYTVFSDSLEIELEAPTNGWLAIGFNAENNIVGSDLLQFGIRSGKVYSEDQFVKAPGVHPSDQSLGGECNIRVLEGIEKAGSSRVRF